MKKLTLNEFCEELSISTATAKNWIKLGKIKSEFSLDYVEKLKKDIESGKKNYLKSRRNKKYVSGNCLYKDYVSKNSKNIQTITNLLSEINRFMDCHENLRFSRNDGTLNKDEIGFLLAECALQLMDKNYNLLKFLECTSPNRHCERSVAIQETNCHSEFISESQKLIEDLISDRKKAQLFVKNNPELFKFKYIYEENEDILGLLYISLSNLGERKSRGAYYTPTTIVKKLVENLQIQRDKTIIDPCCGTGNFLLQLSNNIKLEQIFGNDIDEMSVKITRLNLFLKYNPKNIDVLYSNITQKNILYDDEKKYNYIIGNPPWGAEFSEKEKTKLRKIFSSAVGKNIESYDVFIEKSLNSLNNDGVLAFVLPEAILNVKTHKPIREIIKNKSELKYLEFLGNTFDGVHCPSIIMQLQLSTKNMSCLNAHIVEKNRHYIIKAKREIKPEQFNFNCDDEEYNLIKKIFEGENFYLKNNAEFALGIVTGNNKELISTTKTKENEVIIKGSDIIKYGINLPENYIIFTPSNFQQVAPEKIYRADEKLFYRFIGNKLVFAYDNQQRLSLNSCNILIPKIDGYDIKYIMAVLNSSVAQFIFNKMYNSIKVLRSHIENIPIPKCENQSEIISLVDKLIENPHDTGVYKVLDKKINKLYGLK